MCEPLTPPNCDLTDFPRMMLDVRRLRRSEFDATLDDTAWRAGLNLWMTAWHQVPAASLPDDDANLAKHAGLGRDLRTWKRVRDTALHGWKKATDGRLYHPVLAELVLEAWLEKLAQALSSGAGNAKRWGTVFDSAPIEAEIDTSYGLLTALNPKSKALARTARRRAKSAPNSTPADSPTGTQNASRRDKETVPSGSQENGKLNGKVNGTGDSLFADHAPVKPRAKEPRSRRAPADWTPSEADLEVGRSLGLTDEQIGVELAKMRDHEYRDLRSDWSAAFRNWLRTAADRRPRPNAGGGRPQQPDALDWAASRLSEEYER